MSFSRTYKTYRVEKVRAETALGLSDVIDWSFDGGNLLVEHPSTVILDNPSQHIDRIDQPFTGIPWEDVRQTFFSSIPGGKFSGMTMVQNTTYLFFALDEAGSA
jgi:hypothetical protein